MKTAAASSLSASLQDSAEVVSGTASPTEGPAGEDPEEEVPEVDTVYRPGMISAGLYHTAALNESGEVYAWGDNSFGQLGIGAGSNKEIPMKVEGLSDIVMISAGAYHTLALTSVGDVYAWGRNTFGQIGDGTTAMVIRPVRIENIPPMMAISAGAFHSMALSINGSLYTWGNNTEFQCGDVPAETIYDGSGNVLGSRVLAPQLLAGPGIQAVSAGGSHSLYLDAAGTVYAWGDNRYGQLGDGERLSRNTPSPVNGLSSVVQISAGFLHNLAVTERPADAASPGEMMQNLYAWGSDSSGQLGIGETPDADRVVGLPVRVDASGDADETNDRISLIDAGYYSSVMTVPVTVDGHRRDSVYVWGNNRYGQLGIGRMPNQSKPVRLIGVSNGWAGNTFVPFRSIAAGGYHTALLSVKGFAGVAGRADKGQLGNVSSIDTAMFLGVPLRDAISPGWNAGQKLDAYQNTAYLRIRWETATDNVALAGYRLTYTNKQAEPVTLRLGLVNEYTILDIDKNMAQTLTLHAIDSSGNRSEFPLEYTVGDGTAPTESAPTESVVSGSGLLSGESASSASGDVAPADSDGTQSIDAASGEASVSDEGSDPVVTPGKDDGLRADELRWSTDLYGMTDPPEVPWDVDYIYGAGVVLPPKDRSIAVAVTVTVSVTIVFVLFGLASFRRTHKGHGLFEELFMPHRKPHDTEDVPEIPLVEIGEDVEILSKTDDDGSTEGPHDTAT